MSATPPAPGRLELLRNRFPGWRIEEARWGGQHAIGYTADRGDEHLYAAHLTGLEIKLALAEAERRGLL